MAKETVKFFASKRSLAGVEKFYRTQQLAHEAVTAFASEFGCSLVKYERLDDGDHVAGLTFVDVIPDPNLWRRYIKAHDPQVYCPNKMTPEGQQLAERMAKIMVTPTPWQLVNYVMPSEDQKNYRVWDLDNKAVYPRCDAVKLGNTWVISVHHVKGKPEVVAPMDAQPVSAISNQKGEAR